jgi:EAL domain-containing protein (putative c-di-GMP-specific phosphodiesterase class I)
MYSAKERRSGIERYSASFDHSSPRRLSLAAELRQALDAGALALHYQPQVDLVTGRVRALEALARWAHPRDGAVAPEEFIPIADRYGLIHPFTRWALRTALEDLSRWRVRWPDLTVSVNVSVRNLLDPTLVTSVADLVSQSQVPPEHLTLELVESSVISDPQRSLAVLARLHDMGVRIAIDDFGTGYSSLAYLKRLPVDEVKIDKSFVLHMASDPEDVQIVRSTIDLARNLGLHVVAEGVQDEETWRLLLGLGCDAAQGHLVSPARPAAEIPALLARLGTTSATTSTPASST